MSVRVVLAGFVVLSMVGGITTPSVEPVTERAVLDRFEGETAVLVLDGDRTNSDSTHVERFAGRRTVVIPRDELPPGGRHPDAVFVLWKDERGAVGLRYDRTGTRRRSARVRTRFDRLATE